MHSCLNYFYASIQHCDTTKGEIFCARRAAIFRPYNAFCAHSDVFRHSGVSMPLVPDLSTFMRWKAAQSKPLIERSHCGPRTEYWYFSALFPDAGFTSLCVKYLDASLTT
jgi:hypothetical protein